LSHNTGLPDYSTEKIGKVKSYFDEIYEKDVPITFEETVERTKKLEPHFINGSPGKAFYSDINFDILGKISEKVSGKTLDTLYKEYIIQPLKLEATYLCQPDSKFAPIYLGKEKLYRPITISTAGASGGIISNTSDLIIFLKAFYGGELFTEKYLINDKYNKIQWFPLEYGMGMMRCKMSRLMSPLFPAPEILGHSGSTGSFAFYCPSKKLYIVGTINQINKNPFQTIYLLLNSLE
jgi:CubicO group peptidase (beta-lactamase class C family)